MELRMVGSCRVLLVDALVDAGLWCCPEVDCAAVEQPGGEQRFRQSVEPALAVDDPPLCWASTSRSGGGGTFGTIANAFLGFGGGGSRNLGASSAEISPVRTALLTISALAMRASSHRGLVVTRPPPA